MKKGLCILLDVLAFAFLAAGYVVQYYAKRKLGMVRWLNFYSAKWKEILPLDLLKYIAVIAVVVLSVAVLLFFVRKRKCAGKTDAVLIAAMLLLTAAYAGVTLFWSVSRTAAYYFILPLLGMSALMLMIRNMVSMGINCYEK